ncbi:F11 receptor, tandem duplicate 1 [Alosa sapidissima]|uniref:F11 receptor, tandem duplicate 1 n=1 Tax=Alosa sapidissima TaxID=34773 RepID=UPI001C09E7D2|nr:F11 receptor, tandem duplicate 1 [Alosa sapidissima]XP_041947761.1 F11 receptor, tandem duplicate 1 [Alosa sapidissima]
MIVFIFLGLLLHRADSQFTASTSTPHLKVGENEGADLKCTYSSDFNPNPRIEWSLRRTRGSSFVFFDGQPTKPYEGRVTQYTGGLRFNSVTRDDSGLYVCTVAGNAHSAEAKINLVVLVPPSVPVCLIPTSVRTSQQVILSCFDKDASPPATYKWFKNNEPLPEDPSKFAAYKNMTYKTDPNTGNLEFPAVAQTDNGDYSCEASNEAGPPQRCTAVRMMSYDLNVGGIVAGVIFALLAVCVLVFGVWFAYRKGYIPKMSESKPKTVVYSQPAANYEDDEDGEFRQKSSFVV